jgi:hypothetical protein
MGRRKENSQVAWVKRVEVDVEVEREMDVT